MVIFPEKLHSILDRIEADGQASIVSWLPHGKAFKIHNEAEFASTILPKYFWLLKASFQRQLNIYGFKRVKTGHDRGAIYHELFVREKPELCRGMTRRINVKQQRLAEERNRQGEDRSHRESLYKQHGERNTDLASNSGDSPRQAPQSNSEIAYSHRATENGSFPTGGENPPPAVSAARPIASPAVQHLVAAPDRQSVYVGPQPPRPPGAPLHSRIAAAPRVESFDGRIGQSEFLYRDWDAPRRIYGGELDHGRGAARMRYSPDFSRTLPERSAAVGHEDRHAMYHLRPHGHQGTSFQGHYELDHDFTHDLAYRPRPPMRIPPPHLMETPPRVDSMHINPGVSYDPRIGGQTMMGHIAHRSGIGGPHETTLRRGTGRHVDDAMLLLLLNENSR